MLDNIILNMNITEKNSHQKLNKDFDSLSDDEKYRIIIDRITKSDQVFFYMMVPFMNNTFENDNMKILKKLADEKYEDIILEFNQTHPSEKVAHLDETLFYSLDISKKETQKMFFDYYLFYAENKRDIAIDNYDCTFKVGNDRSYEPYSFFFTSSQRVIMSIEHHTRSVVIFE